MALGSLKAFATGEARKHYRRESHRKNRKIKKKKKKKNKPQKDKERKILVEVQTNYKLPKAVANVIAASLPIPPPPVPRGWLPC